MRFGHNAEPMVYEDQDHLSLMLIRCVPIYTRQHRPKSIPFYELDSNGKVVEIPPKDIMPDDFNHQKGSPSTRPRQRNAKQKSRYVSRAFCGSIFMSC
jgi:hypothetical protein